MKKRIISVLFIVIISILGLPFVLLLVSDFTGIGKKEGGFKTYNVISATKVGNELIQKYNIKCVAKDVECLAFVEMCRGETFFAYNIDHNNYYFYENISYKKVPKNIIKKHQITAHFTWLESNGKIIFIILFSIGAVLFLCYWFFLRK